MNSFKNAFPNMCTDRFLQGVCSVSAFFHGRFVFIQSSDIGLSAQVIHLVAHSSEFENIVVREEEQQELATLMHQSCPLEVRGGPDDKYGKINILIQVEFSHKMDASDSLLRSKSSHQITGFALRIRL